MGMKATSLFIVRLMSYVCIIAILTGCAVYMPTIQIPYGSKTSEDLVAVTALVLQEYDFTVTVANSSVGIVTTDWRTVSSTAEEVVNVLFTGQAYRERMQLSVVVNQAKNTVVIKPKKERYSGLYGWSLCKLESNDKQLLCNIAETIKIRVNGVSDTVIWEEPGRGRIPLSEIQRESTH